MRNIGANEGLHDLLVNAIYEDANGLMWFGTSSSLVMFDGINLTLYDIPNQDGRQRVEAISGNGQSVYFCTNQSLFHLEHSRDSIHCILQDEIDGVLRDLCLMDNHLYIATSVGLYDYHVHTHDLQHVLFNPATPSAPQNELRHIRPDSKGNLWLTSKAGLHSVTHTGTISNYYYSDLPQNGFTELTVTDSLILLGSFHNGIYGFRIEDAQFRLIYKTVSPIVSLQVKGDTLLAATDGDGVFLYDFTHSTSTHLTTSPSSGGLYGGGILSSNSVYRALMDSRGILWVGYYQQGLDYTLGQTDQFGIHHTDMLNTEGMAVRSLAVRGQQRLIGTRQGLYLVDKARHITHTYTDKQLGAKMVFATLYHHNRYYVGTYGGGLYTLDTLGLNLRSVSSPYIGHEIFSLCADPQGRLWVGSDIGFAVLQGDKVVRHFNADNSILPPGLGYCVYFDHMQRGWLCTAGGVVLYDAQGDSLTTAPLPDDFPEMMVVRSIYNDRYNRLFFMPDKGYTYVVDSLLNPVTDFPSLPEDNLFMIEDSTGQLWMGTKLGLFSLRDNSLHQYGFANGLPSSIFTLCQPAIDHEGTVWFGNSNGLIYLKPDSVRLLAGKRPVFITHHSLRNKSLSVRFSDLRYSAPHASVFEYRLDGEDDAWQVLTARNEVVYSYLSAGKYYFRVRVAGEPDTETVLPVLVPLSPWTWCALLLLLALLLSAYPLYRLYRRRLVQASDVVATAEVARSKYANVSIPEQTLDDMHRRMDELMVRDRIYLRADLKIAEIAAMLDVPTYQLSYLFTQHMQTTFYDYLYHFRIEEFKLRVRNGDIKRYTVESLAEQCGFNSRASFFRNFKREVGMTPNEFIKSHD